MKSIKAQSELVAYSFDQLSEDYLKVVKQSQQAFLNSYSPYSNFAVGAAVLLDNGEIILGSNQENAAYPSGLCAERTAMFYVGSTYPNQVVKAVAGAVQKPIENYPFPCGGCLQVLSEYQEKQNQPIDVILVHPSENKVLISRGLQNLLPFAFKKQHLGK